MIVKELSHDAHSVAGSFAYFNTFWRVVLFAGVALHRAAEAEQRQNRAAVWTEAGCGGRKVGHRSCLSQNAFVN